LNSSKRLEQGYFRAASRDVINFSKNMRDCWSR